MDPTKQHTTSPVMMMILPPLFLHYCLLISSAHTSNGFFVSPGLQQPRRQRQPRRTRPNTISHYYDLVMTTTTKKMPPQSPLQSPAMTMTILHQEEQHRRHDRRRGFSIARTKRTRSNRRRFVIAPLFSADAAHGSDSADATTGGATGGRRRGVWERLLDTVISSPKKAVQRSNSITDDPNDQNHDETTILKTTPQWRVQLLTLTRVGLPSVLAGLVATLTFPAMALFLAGIWNTNPGTMAILSQDSSQFVQNFLTVAGLLFSILVGQTYYFLYTQQESLYYALFQEVTEAKSLLEQVALVCQGRSMYQKCLRSIAKYVQYDLKCIQDDPAILLSARPVDDPLEAIMYMTSVGIPSSVYETVKSLRAARAQRLGALQRKLPGIHMGLLWTLAIIELMSFPLLGAGTQTIGGYNILTIEGILFGVMTAGIVLTLRVVAELWRPAGGAYNVDAALSTMVRGLERELQARMNGRLQVSSQSAPSGAWDNNDDDNGVAARTTTISTRR